MILLAVPLVNAGTGPLTLDALVAQRLKTSIVHRLGILADALGEVAAVRGEAGVNLREHEGLDERSKRLTIKKRWSARQGKRRAIDTRSQRRALS